MTIDIDKLREELRFEMTKEPDFIVMTTDENGTTRSEIQRIDRADLRALLDHIDNVDALLREAGEVMRRALPYVDDLATMERIDAFLAKLAPAPAPEPVREDTYPDRVSMEPWPHIGHAPGGSDADQ